MAFVVFTTKDAPFTFSGAIGGDQKRLVFADKDSQRIYKTGEVLAIMQEDFADQYGRTMAELERLKHGDPGRN